jgi:starch synthase
MPLYLDPCALPCRIGPRYGALPIAYDAGAIQDSVTHLDAAADRGTGFLFEHFDTNGFLWAIDQAMAFFGQSRQLRSSQVQRIMAASLATVDSGDTVRRTTRLYSLALNRFQTDQPASPPEALSRIAA